jgi:hypothetical protein
MIFCRCFALKIKDSERERIIFLFNGNEICARVQKTVSVVDHANGMIPPD